jgi:hypothetical protein
MKTLLVVALIVVMLFVVVGSYFWIHCIGCGENWGDEHRLNVLLQTPIAEETLTAAAPITPTP